MNPNDAALTSVFTAITGGKVADDGPNEVAGVLQPSFDLVIEAVAGQVVGDAATTYELYIGCADLTSWTSAPGLVPGSPLAETFSASLDGWAKVSAWNAHEYDKSKNYTVTPAAGSYTHGHTFQYTVSLVSAGNLIVSTAQSNTFVLV